MYFNVQLGLWDASVQSAYGYHKTNYNF